MMINNSFSQSNNFYSKSMQHRMNMMLQDADKLFSLGWLRKRLWKELSEVVEDVKATEYGNYADELQGSNEKYFMWHFLSVCQKSVVEVKRIIDNAYDDPAPIIELIEQREELIREFARMPLSRSWENVINDDETWRNFARRLPLDDQNRREDFARFFEILDHISVITDIICHKADKYGLQVDYSAMEDYEIEKKSEQLTDEILETAINSVSHLINTQSAWAAIFCVLRDDFGRKNKSQFERDISELGLKKSIPTCPENTISRTMSNNDYMSERITKWPQDNKFKKLITDFRAALSKLLS